MGDNDNSIQISLSDCKTIAINNVYKSAKFGNRFLNLNNLLNKNPDSNNYYTFAYDFVYKFDSGFDDFWYWETITPTFYYRFGYNPYRFYQYLDGQSYLNYGSDNEFQIKRNVNDLDFDSSLTKLITCDEEGYVTLFNFDIYVVSQTPVKESKLEGNFPCSQVVYRRNTAWALSSGKVTRIEVSPLWKLTPVETNKNVKYIYLAKDSNLGTTSLRLIGDTEILTLNCHENCQTCSGPDFDECCHVTCSTCSGPNFDNCLSCNSGFYLASNNVCKPCHRKCLTCSTDRKCTECKAPSLT